MTGYHVYAYLDLSKPTQVHTRFLTFFYEPIYIGMGKGKRDTSHLKNLDSRRNLPFYNRLKKMIYDGNMPSVVRVFENLAQDEAFKLEVELISEIRRRHEGGPLLNISGGGPGFKNPTPLTSAGLQRSAWNRGLPTPETIRRKISLSVTGFTHTDKSKEKIAARSVGARNPGAKNWVVTDPYGNEYLITSLRTFCEERSLSESALRLNKNSGKPVLKGVSKGWAARWAYAS